MNKTLFKDENQEGEKLEEEGNLFMLPSDMKLKIKTGKNLRKRENLFMLPSDMKLKRKREIDWNGHEY